MRFPASLRWPEIARRGFLRLAGLGALTQAMPAAAAVQPAPAGPNCAPPEPWTGSFSGQNVWGYTDKHSVREGEAFNVMLSTKPGAAGRRGASNSPALACPTYPNEWRGSSGALGKGNSNRRLPGRMAIDQMIVMAKSANPCGDRRWASGVGVFGHHQYTEDICAHST